MEERRVKPHREKGKALDPAKRFKGAYTHTHTQKGEGERVSHSVVSNSL